MWFWIILATVFLFLFGRSLSESLASTRSRPAAFTGTILDGFGMVLMAAGVFGLLMALVFGVFTDHGIRLTGASLRDVLIWSGGMIVAAFLLLVVGSAVRRAGARPSGVRTARA